MSHVCQWRVHFPEPVSSPASQSDSGVSDESLDPAAYRTSRKTVDSASVTCYD